MMRYVSKPLLLAVSTFLLLNACSTPSRYAIDQDRGPDQDVDVSHVQDAVPQSEPRSKYGNPASYEVNGKTYYVKDSSKGFRQTGQASWYGKKFHGHRTSSGETYDMYAMTAAHTTLPLPTYARITNLENKRSVVVRINDRGPFHSGRIVDLSYAAAKKLGILGQGTGQVELVAIDPQQSSSTQVTQQQIDDSQLYVQVGAFNSRYNAERLRKRLMGMITPSRVKFDYAEEQNLYRVRIGPFTSNEEAERLAQLISNKGISHPHIVVD